MKTLDRRGLLRGILFGAAAAGVAFAPIAATAMPLDDTQLPGALDGWIEKTQVWVAPARVVAPTRVNFARSILTERAAGPSPMMRSSWKSSIAG